MIGGEPTPAPDTRPLPTTSPAQPDRPTQAGVAVVGCGFVADLYADNFAQHDNLDIRGCVDRRPDRAQAYAQRHGYRVYNRLDDALADPAVTIIANLTNPASHFEVSAQAIDAGKHVYSEKPLAMAFDDAAALVERAKAAGVWLIGAPCNVLSESAQAVNQALTAGRVGKVRAVYAELDDGLIHRAPYRKWISASGNPWPAEDEFRVGCTLEHAGYYLTWLCAMFGPVRSVGVFGMETVPEKLPDTGPDPAPDVTVGCMRFDDGVFARLTCSIVAQHDHHFRVWGDEGVISVPDCWDYRAKVTLRPYMNVRRRHMFLPWGRSLPLPPPPTRPLARRGAARMDFARGVADLADAVLNARTPRLSPRFCLHVNEVALLLHRSLAQPGTYTPTTDFDHDDLTIFPTSASSADTRTTVATNATTPDTNDHNAALPPDPPAPIGLMVTGATGFLGRHIVMHALNRGHHVIAVVRPNRAGPPNASTQAPDHAPGPSRDTSDQPWHGHERVSVLEADLSNAAALDPLIATLKAGLHAEPQAGPHADPASGQPPRIDVVVHAAAALEGDDDHHRRNTVEPTRRLLQAIQQTNPANSGPEANAPPPAFILVSSFSVYDFLHLPEGGTLDETTPLEPRPDRRDAYCRAKLAQEALVREANQGGDARNGGLSTCIFRPGVIYGPGRLANPWLLGVARGPLLLNIAANTTLPLTYVEHCANAIVLAAERCAKSQTPATTTLGPINIVDDDRVSGRDYLRLLHRYGQPTPDLALPLPWPVMRSISTALATLLGPLAGKAPGILRAPALHARYKPLSFSNAGLREQLRWRPTHTLHQAFKASVTTDGNQP